MRQLRGRKFLGLVGSLVVVAGLLVGVAAPSVAAPVAGKPCTKVGKSVTVGWTELTCKRTTRGKVWKVTARGPVYYVKEAGMFLDCTADPTAVRIDETSARVYYVTSTSGPCPDSQELAPDSAVVPLVGGTVVPDPGRRFIPIVGPAGPHKRVMSLPDGGYRIFFSTPIGAEPVGIGSATSEDGLVFVVDPGLRVTVADAQVGDRPALSPGDVVPIGNGRYRMYFSSFKFGPRDPMTEVEVIKSAVSTDLLNWTVEPGDRVGGTARLSGSGEHPAAIRHPDGGVTLFYGRPTNQYGLYYAWSSDGLTFTRERFLVSRVLDSAFIRLSNGKVTGFVGRRDDVAERGYIDRIILTPR